MISPTMGQSNFDDRVIPQPILTVNDLVQYSYCPRKFYFLRVAKVPVVIPSKMAWSKQHAHDKESQRNKHRKKSLYGFDPELVVTIEHDVALFSPTLGLKGVADVILHVIPSSLPSRDQNPEWQEVELIPIDIKYTDYINIHKQWRLQVTALAMLLEEERAPHVKVRRAMIHFSRQRKTVTVNLTPVDRRQVHQLLKTLRDLYFQERLPKPAPKKSCNYCEVYRFCFRDAL